LVGGVVDFFLAAWCIFIPPQLQQSVDVVVRQAALDDGKFATTSA